MSQQVFFGTLAVGDWFVWAGSHYEKTDVQFAECIEDKAKSQLFWDQAYVFPFENQEQHSEESHDEVGTEESQKGSQEGQEVLSENTEPAGDEKSQQATAQE